MTLAAKRASADFRSLQKSITEKQNPHILSAALVGDDMYHWTVVVTPPADSIYAGRNYQLDVALSTDFPAKPPAVKFTTPIFSPAVMPDGLLCERLIDNEEYKPTQKVQAAVEKVITAIFVDYAKIEVINEEAGKLLATSPADFKKKVDEYKKKA